MIILQNTGDKYGKYKESYISRCNQAITLLDRDWETLIFY